MRKSLVHLLVATLALPVFAQPASAQDAVIRSTTRIVQVSVIVKDKSGQPVTGLKREDFSISDGGKDEKIQLFSMETNDPPPAQKQEKLPPGTYTNRLTNSTAPHSVSVILLDSLNSLAADQNQSKQAVINFLLQLKPTDHVALYALESKLRIIQDFTTDASLLLEAINKYKSGANLGLASENAGEPAISTAQIGGRTGGDQFSQIFSDFQDSINDATAQSANYMATVRTQQSLKALEIIAGRLAGTPGRKNLIWVAGNFPLRIAFADIGFSQQYRDLAPDMERTARAINTSNIAVYPVDASGLGLTMKPQSGADSNGAPSTSNAPKNNGRPGRNSIGLAEQIEATASAARVDSHSAMNELADRTGGRAFYNQNDVATAIRTVQDDARISYIIGYAPTHNKWTGQFREIKLKVNRPGVTVLYRKGYLALPDVTTDEQQRKLALGQAAASPVTASGLGIKVHPIRKDAGTINMNIEMDIHEINFDMKDGKNDGLVDLLFVMRDAKGTSLDQVHQPAALSLSPEDYKRLEGPGIGFTLPIPIPAGTTRVRIVVRDNSSGQVGSLDVPVT